MVLVGDVEPQLRRELGFYDGIGIVIGIMIGSGIFASPGSALAAAGSPALALAAWALAALLVAVASLAYSELAISPPVRPGAGALGSTGREAIWARPCRWRAASCR